jgi:hypothetical protein
MDWSSTAITWDLQMRILWIVLPPIFIGCGFLTLVLPKLLARETVLPARTHRAVGQIPAQEGSR